MPGDPGERTVDWHSQPSGWFRNCMRTPSKGRTAMTDYSDVDDGTPRGALDLAGQAVRWFNHRSGTRFNPSNDGWLYVPDVYRCLGELTYLTGMLPQVAQQMSESMRAALDVGDVGIDYGASGTPEAVIDEANAALDRARVAAHQLYQAWGDAQSAINRVHYAGPELEHAD